MTNTAATPETDNGAESGAVNVGHRLKTFGVAVLAPRICSLGEATHGGSEVLLWEDVAICKAAGISVRVYARAARKGTPVQLVPTRTNAPLITSLEYCGRFVRGEPKGLLLAYNEPAIAGWAPARAIVRFDWSTPLPRYWNWPGWLSRFQSACYVFPSASERQLFLQQHERIPEQNAVVLPNAVDLELFRPRRQDSERMDNLRVGFAGQWIRQKGICELLDAWHIVKSALPAAQLFLAGGPDLWKNCTRTRETEPAIASILQAREQGLLQWVGSLPRSQMPDFWNSVDVAVVPSYSESFGLGALEALACGVPVIAAAVGGLREIIVEGESGLFVPVRDSRALANALVALLKDEGRRLCLARAARLRAECFSLERRSKNLLKLLTQRLESPN